LCFGDELLMMEPVAHVQDSPMTDVGEAEPPTALRLGHIVAGYVVDWRPTPRRQFVFILSGMVEVTVGSGDARRFGPGSVLLFENTAGQGHQTRALDTDDVIYADVAV
jgi:hypothetical protein